MNLKKYLTVTIKITTGVYNIMYILYDRETMTTVEHCQYETKEKCLWKGLAFLTEDWDYEMYDEAFSQHDTLESVLDNYNYEVREI